MTNVKRASRAAAGRVAVPASVVSRPAARLDGLGRVLGCGREALYLEVCGEVLTVTARGLPLLPVGIELTVPSVPRVASGAPVSVGAGVLRVGVVAIGVAGALEWDPRAGFAPAPALAARGREVLAALGEARPGIAAGALFDAIARGDRGAAAGTAAGLIGRGGGLTPEGDDLVAGALVALWAARLLVPSWRAALVPPDLGARTGALSASLLRAAARGEVAAPLQDVLDPGAPEPRWRGALDRLVRIGHSTGRAWAYGAAAAAVAVGDRTNEEAST